MTVSPMLDRAAGPAPMSPIRVVLDTHVVLDWLVFRDPRVATLAQAVQDRLVTWLVTPSMEQELMAVLERPVLQRWQPDRGAVAHAWTHWAQACMEAPPAPWRCADPADQMFLDLAHQHRVDALLTRDHALRACGRRARRTGLWIGPPEAWPGGPAAARPG